MSPDFMLSYDSIVPSHAERTLSRLCNPPHQSTRNIREADIRLSPAYPIVAMQVIHLTMSKCCRTSQPLNRPC